MRLRWATYEYPLLSYEVRTTVVVAKIIIDGKPVTIANTRDCLHKVIAMNGKVVDRIDAVRMNA